MGNENKFIQIWDKFIESAFVTKDVDTMMKLMTEDTIVNHVPTRTGGVGASAVRDFYSKFCIGTHPPDTKTVVISRTVGATSLVAELILSFTHTQEMPWFFPGIEPTGKYVEVPYVVIWQFQDDKIASQTLYWDQASALVQIGLLNPTGLPVEGIEEAAKVANSREVSARILP